jgi:formylglycine-generating enzyme required for sulfatase activity
MKKKIFMPLLIAAMTVTMNLQAQVKIGKDEVPAKGALLDLNNDEVKGGLLLPNVSITKLDEIPMDFSDTELRGLGNQTQLTGLTVYNTNEATGIEKGLYVWDGDNWNPLNCGCEETVTLPVNFDPACASERLACAASLKALNPVTLTNTIAFSASGVAFNMKPVTGGVFYMGSQTNSAYPNYVADGSTGKVPLRGVSSFYMGETQVTQGLWDAVMGTGNSNHYDGNPNAWGNTYGTGAAYPVYYENWYACITFCNKLSLMENKTPCYSVKISSVEVDWANLAYGSIPLSSNTDWDAATCNFGVNGFRLPTETEWEYAARGGQQNEYTRTFGASGTQFIYSGSNTVDEVAWYTSNTSPVGSRPVKGKAANNLGLYDMSGNVCEWCWDWYEAYNCCESANYTGPSTGTNRVLRGGGWSFQAIFCRVSTRFNFPAPYTHGPDYGFRLASSSVE